MTIALKGGKELEQFLSAFPAKLQKGAVRAGVTAAAKVLRTEARLQAPKDTGKFAKSIRSSSSRVNQDGTVSIRVFVDRKKPHGWLGPMIEYGIAPHDITIKPGKAGKLGDEFVSGTISHPGVVAQPFLRPALDLKAGEAIEAFGVRIRDYLKDKTGFSAPVLEVDNAA